MLAGLVKSLNGTQLSAAQCAVHVFNPRPFHSSRVFLAWNVISLKLAGLVKSLNGTKLSAAQCASVKGKVKRT